MQIKSHVLLHEKLVNFKLNMQDSELFAVSMPNYPVKMHYECYGPVKKQAFIGISTLVR